MLIYKLILYIKDIIYLYYNVKFNKSKIKLEWNKYILYMKIKEEIRNKEIDKFYSSFYQSLLKLIFIC